MDYSYTTSFISPLFGAGDSAWIINVLTEGGWESSCLFFMLREIEGGQSSTTEAPFPVSPAILWNSSPAQSDFNSCLCGECKCTPRYCAHADAKQPCSLLQSEGAQKASVHHGIASVTWMGQSYHGFHGSGGFLLFWFVNDITHN